MNIKQLHVLFLNSNGISTDSRSILPGFLFFALKGAHFNGNNFAHLALNAGASYCVLDQEQTQKNQRFILVDDVLKTLQQLAFFHRNYLDIPIIGLTGSNGKTTTKELIKAVLSQRFKTHATQGNFNNHIGVPLTLLQMDTSTEIGIIEMGANHIGEINDLCAIAAPTHGYITNFGKAHLEGFGSEAGVVEGKSELYSYIKNRGGLIFANADDTTQLNQIAEYKKIYTFSENNEADIQLSMNLKESFLKLEFQDLSIETQLIGIYNFSNVSAAIAIGQFFKVSPKAIQKGIKSYRPKNNRSEIIKKGSNSLVLDAYNANPSSMAAALENFNTMAADSKIVILGDMFELGEQTAEEHQCLIDLVISFDFSAVYFVGAHFSACETSKTKADFFKTTESFCKALKAKEIKDNLILIKGSRGMALETVVDCI